MDCGNRILLVEDEAIIAMVERKGLEKYGYSVLTASSGLQALDLFQENPDIDLVLMDIDLGAGMDGTETALAILGQRHLPVVFLSSHTEKEIVDRTERITSYGYVVKNSALTVLDASIKMAFKLFAEREMAKTRQAEIETANAKLEETVGRLVKANEELERSRNEIRETLESLGVSENRFHHAFHASPACQIITTFPEGIIQDVNEAFCRLLGYTREELVGHGSVELRIWQRNEDRESAVDRLRVDGRILARESVFRTKSGDFRTVISSVEQIEFKGLHCIISSAVDITDRKETEESARNAERFMTSVIDSLAEHVAIVDATGRIVKVNGSWERFAGENGAAMAKASIGANYLEACAAAQGEDAAFGQAVGDAIRAILAGRLSRFSLEYPCHSPAAERWFRVRVVPFAGEGPPYVVVSHENITEWHEAERRRRLVEERYRRLVELSPDAVFINEGDRIVFVNPACAELLAEGDARAILGRAPFDFIHPDYHGIVKERIARMMAEGTRAPFRDVLMRRSDGSTVLRSTTAVPFGTETGSAILVILHEPIGHGRTEGALAGPERNSGSGTGPRASFA